MIIGQKNKFKLNLEMSKILYKWIGASKFIYNAKIEENDYLLTFGRKFFPKTQYQFDEEFHFFDRTYAQFKNQGGEWLNEVPSPILRDAATIWFRAMKDSFTGKCERPRRKNRFSNRYVWLCDKLFEFHLINNRWHLEIGT
jgi:putative transposase